MNASELINTLIPHLDQSDHVDKALACMETFRCSDLPVVKNKCLLGFVSHKTLMGIDREDPVIGQLDLVGKTCAVEADHTLDQVIETAYEHGLGTVAVLDHQQQYRGIIVMDDLPGPLTHAVNHHTESTTLVLSINLIDYSLAKVAQLVEGNNAKILDSIMVKDSMDDKKIKLNLKINCLDSKHILATFERFGYKIISEYQAHQTHTTIYDERAKMLERYLNP